MMRRIFIAINPIKGIKKKMVHYQTKYPDLPVKWTPQENLHITLSFLGDVKDQNIVRVINFTKKTALKYKPFFVVLNEICYGPSHKKPRMVWITGKKSKEMGALKTDLERGLFNLPARNITTFKNGYTPHVTLGRLQKEFYQIKKEERPKIKRDVFLKFEVFSVDIIESRLRKGGSQYTKLQTINLKK